MFGSHWFTTRKVCLPIFTMEKKIERVSLGFCVCNGITALASLKILLKCFGESTKVKKTVLENRRVGIREIAEALITGDETWVYEYDVKTTEQSSRI